MRKIIITNLVASVLLTLASISHAENLLPKSAAQILKKHGIPVAQAGVYIAWRGGKAIVAHNLDKAFNPASSIKLVTSMAALDLLGPGHQWLSGFYAAAPIVEGSLRGDLYFRGNGDPYLTNESLLYLIAGLKRRGLNSVAGDIVIDDSFFEFDQFNPASFDGAGTKSYNASPGASVVNFGSSQVILHVKDNQVFAFLEPPSSTFVIENKLKIRKAKCTGNWRRRLKERLVRNEDGTAILSMSGTYPSGCSERSFFLLGQSDPVAHMAGAIHRQFVDLGGKVDGAWREEKMPRNAKRITTMLSRTLTESLIAMNKFSNNFMARNIFLSLGKDPKSKIHTKEKSRENVINWFSKQGIDTTGLSIENGSGLSRTTRITPRQFGDALVNFGKKPYMNELLSSLSVLGKDGTTKKWNTKRKSKGHAHIKTGTLSNARSTVGVVHNPHDDIVFVVLVETRGTAAARRAIQDLLEWSYSYKLAK